MITKIKLIKVSDVEDPLHPGNIPDGYIVVGTLLAEPIVGEAFRVGGTTWRTSKVVELLPNDHFKTLNSLYKLERSLVAEKL